MRSFVFYLMVLLMLVWSAVFLMELAYIYYRRPKLLLNAVMASSPRPIHAR